MNSRPPIGQAILDFIRRQGETFGTAAEKLEISESLLAHIINGRRALSEDVENRVLASFSMNSREQAEFSQLAKFSRGLNFRPTNQAELKLVIEFQKRLNDIQRAPGQNNVGKPSLQGS